jgi:hypothetical protein
MEGWVPNLNIARLAQSMSVSVNMFEMGLCAPPRQLHQRTEFCQEDVPSDHVRRIQKLEDELAKLQNQLHDQGNRICELASSNAKLKASCKTTDTACQTDPWLIEEKGAVPATAAVIKKDASCNAWRCASEVEDITTEDQTFVPRHIKTKKKRKPRKNRSRGARSRAKAAAALALLEAESAAPAPPLEDFPGPVAETVATLTFSPAETAPLVQATNDASIPVATAEDRRCTILPSESCLLGYVSPSTGVNMKHLFQGFHPPLVDPCRFSRWFKVVNLDLGIRHA